MGVVLNTDEAIRMAEGVFESVGASLTNAHIVADHLVTSDRMGLGSHGLNRVTQYVAEIRRGDLDPAAVPTTTMSSPTHAHVDGMWGFGQVAGLHAVEAVRRAVATYGMGFATVRRVGHTGRLSAYTEPLAMEGNLAIGFAAGARRFHRLAPHGGRQGRLSTNPISWAIPTSSNALVADFSTSTTPEGRVRMWRDTNERVPPDVLCNANGDPSDEPEDLYTDPPGFLLPLGGLRHGHKGYALALLAEAASTLMGLDDTADDEGRGNNLSILAIRGDDELPIRADRTVQYLTSTEPIDPARPVLIPGQLEYEALARNTNTPIADATWHRLVDLADELGVPIPDLVL